jgi:hypothetical protein
MVKTPAERVRDSEASRRARGEKQLRVWVPNPKIYGPEDEKQVRDLAAKLCAERTKEPI